MPEFTKGQTVFHVRFNPDCDRFHISEVTVVEPASNDAQGFVTIQGKSEVRYALPARKLYPTMNAARTHVCDVFLIRLEKIKNARNRLIAEIAADHKAATAPKG